MTNEEIFLVAGLIMKSRGGSADRILSFLSRCIPNSDVQRIAGYDSRQKSEILANHFRGNEYKFTIEKID